jgi:glutathione peroxidase
MRIIFPSFPTNRSAGGPVVAQVQPEQVADQQDREGPRGEHAPDNTRQYSHGGQIPRDRTDQTPIECNRSHWSPALVDAGIFAGVTIYDVSIDALRGGPADLGQYRGKAMLIVNVASKCGLTPQYAGLQKLAEQYADRGLVVLGVPCNQFAGQEPGTEAEIEEFCQVNYGVTFPQTAKVDVNGEHRHPLYEQLAAAADAEGKAGDVLWNFEKFLVSPAGEVVGRFRPQTTPDAPELVAAVEQVLPA